MRPSGRSAVAALLLLAAAGCAGGRDANEPEAGETLRIALASDVRDLLPPLYESATEGNVVAALNLPLLDSSFDCALQFNPALAKAWRFSEDGRTLVVELERGVTWPDGVAVTAEDVRFSWELLGDPRVRGPRAELLARFSPDARPRVVDPHTLEWEFVEATDRAAMLAFVASVYAVPKHLLGTADRASLRGHTLNVRSPVGNGPWAVKAWEPGRELVLKPNRAFAGPEAWRPKLGRVELRILPAYDARLAAMQGGSVDVVEGVAVRDADALVAADPDIQLRRRGWRSVEYVAWNAVDPADWRARASASADARPSDSRPHPLFADREVRRALGMAIDVDGLIRALLTSERTGEVYGRPAVGTITPALCGIHNDAVPRLPFEPDAARARLAELGWTDTNSDGWLDREGRVFRFTLLTNAAWPRRTEAAELVREQLARVGVDVVVEPLEPALFYERLKARDFDAALSSWAASLYVDPSPIWGEESEFNFTTYQSARVQALLAKGRAETNADAAAEVWRELQAVIYEDQPYAFLYWADEIVAIDGRFQDATVDLVGGWRDLHRWRTEAPAAVDAR